MLPFYLSAKTRPSPTLFRDDDTVIQARIRAVTIACICSCMVTLWKLLEKNMAYPTLVSMGLAPTSLGAVLWPLALTALLFAGPLFERGVVKGRWRVWIRLDGVGTTLSEWTGWRNYVAVAYTSRASLLSKLTIDKAPVSEEVLFRTAMVPLHSLAGISFTRTVFLTPLYFGIAHIHHFYEFKLTHPRMPWTGTLLRSVFQFAFTSVFGFFATFVFLRTHSLPAVIFIHSFCNWCGLPRLWGRVEAGAPIHKGEPAQEMQETGIGWTVAYYIILIGGATGFYRNLWLWTDFQPRIYI